MRDLTPTIAPRAGARQFRVARFLGRVCGSRDTGAARAPLAAVSRVPLVALASLISLISLVSLGGCAGCEAPAPDPQDAGVAVVQDAGLGRDAGDVPMDAGPDAGAPPVDAGPQCTPETLGYGEPCAANAGDPLCGEFLCSADTDALFCYDLGPNACGGCGELDLSAGAIGEACGEHGCGRAFCNAEKTGSECLADHPRNVCGGCSEDIEEGLMPGDTCSTCGSGSWTCSRDGDSMGCWGGRAPDNSCGGCGRCVLFHGAMDERFSGGYVRAGTRVFIDDIGEGKRVLTFDPLVEGPGLNALSYAQIYISETPTTENPAVPLTAPFSSLTQSIPADPNRLYEIPDHVNLDGARYVVIYDAFVGSVISAGALHAGPPDDLDISAPDAGPALDAGPDAGGAMDAGTPGDAG